MLQLPQMLVFSISIKQVLNENQFNAYMELYYWQRFYTVLNFYALPDKVMSYNQRHIGVQEHHLMFKDPYIWSQKEDVSGTKHLYWIQCME